MNMSQPQHHNVDQGTPEWLALRASGFYTASELAAAMGISPHGLTRGELIRMKALGLEQEIWAKLAEDGHEAEAGARPIAEAFIGADLFPGTVTREVDGLPLLASLDGLTIDDATTWEHKLWNDELAASVNRGVVPKPYRPQLEQGMLVTGASRCLFTVSDGTAERCVHCWYEPDADLRGQIVPVWSQFRADVESYVHVEEAPAAVPVVPDALPVLMLEISGAVRDTNLGTYQQVVLDRIRAINTDLQTDQDFADAEAVVKFLGDAEKEVEAAKGRALAQTQSVDELFRAVDALKAEMRSKRLELNKLVSARKDAIRWEIVEDARRAIEQHCIAIAEDIDERMPAPGVPADFSSSVAGAMKGRRTITTLRDAAAQVVADAKIAIDARMNRMLRNLSWFDNQLLPSHLFADLPGLIGKESDDFQSAVHARVAAHKEELRRRDEEARARIQAEEERKARAAAEAEMAAERARIRADEEARARAAAPVVPERTAEPDEHPLPVPPRDGCYLPEGCPEDAKPIACEPAVPWRVQAAEGEVLVVIGAGRVYLGVDDATALRDALTRSIREAKKLAA